MPPCEDSLRKHVMRENCQACVWGCSLQSNPSISDPAGYGWNMANSTENETSLQIDWMDGKSAQKLCLSCLHTNIRDYVHFQAVFLCQAA